MSRRALALAGLALAGIASALWRQSRSAAPPLVVPAPDRAAPPPTNGAPITRAELYRRAQELDIPGRSKMTKAELASAVRGRDREERSP